MNCPKCGSENVNVQVIQTGAKTSKKGNGCLWSIGHISSRPAVRLKTDRPTP